MEEMDEYVVSVDSHRIQLISKLKAVFDKFRSPEESVADDALSASQVEMALAYMKRPLDSVQVNLWLTELKAGNSRVSFPEFVSHYTAFFRDIDPDIQSLEKSLYSPKEKYGQSKKVSNEEKDEREKRMEEKDDDSEDDEDNTSSEYFLSTQRFLNEDIVDIKVLAELKSVFDRFAVDDKITPPEACQALTEAGLVTPRKEVARYFRERKHLVMQRAIGFYEFIRAFAALR